MITTDGLGRVTFLNAEAERLTEWSHAEARGRPLPEVFHIVNETARQPLDDPATKVLRTGRVVGLANHTLLLGRQGRETIIDDSAAPIQESGGGTVGVVLVFRDGTEKKRKTEQLAQSLSLLRATIEATRDGVLVVNTENRITVYNSRFWKCSACRRRWRPPATTPACCIWPARRPPTPMNFSAGSGNITPPRKRVVRHHPHAGRTDH